MPAPRGSRMPRRYTARPSGQIMTRVRRMATIETLGGSLDTSELGTVLMHEHVFNITAEIQIAHPGFNGWDPETEIPKAQRTLKGVKQAGIGTLVELSPIGLGRSLGLIRRACEGR